jgi:hypothetical protein
MQVFVSSCIQASQGGYHEFLSPSLPRLWSWKYGRNVILEPNMRERNGDTQSSVNLLYLF